MTTTLEQESTPVAVVPEQERTMSIVMIGHVDHGKSTVIGRLLADTDALPKGKLDQVREMCRRNAKPFEYAFLLDALKDERSQGITIDTARCFFRTKKRPYILIDAPGHIEFLKNMITGAARAAAATIVIDAREGIQENSKRHGFMVSMLGIRQISVIVNKMDLVDHSEDHFKQIQSDYTDFLTEINVVPVSYIPVSAVNGDNIARRSEAMPWYDGPTVLDQIDGFDEPQDLVDFPFRYPVQDIYKFTEQGDDRRFVAGRITTGTLNVDDEVIFHPSGKRSRIQSIELFNTPDRTSASAGEVVGFTLTEQIYAHRGELMVRADEQQPHVSTRMRVNLFWMGKAPMVTGKTYKLKVGGLRSPVKLVEVIHVLDASELTTVTTKNQIDRHDVAECILETPKPTAFDLENEIAPTGRAVIVDNHEIAGAGIILESVISDDSTLKEHIQAREFSWRTGDIAPQERASIYHHGAKMVVLTGAVGVGKEELARALEKRLFYANFKVYYFQTANLVSGLDSDVGSEFRMEHIRRLGELARIFTDSGQIFITAVTDADDYEVEALELLNQPNEVLVVNMGDSSFGKYESALMLDANPDTKQAVKQVCQLLKEKNVIQQYAI